MKNKEVNYESVKLGNQVWMLKNLDVSHFRNGDPIPEVPDEDEWCNLDSPAWCYYNNDPLNGKKFGKLYHWYAVIDHRGLAPEGWYIPSEAEWEILNAFLGGDKGEEACWNEVRLDDKYVKEFQDSAINVAFCALPGGFRESNGEFYGDDEDLNCNFCGNWWTTTPNESDCAYIRTLFLEYSSILYGSTVLISGQSVRCIKD